MRHIIVDGYNVIRRDPALNALINGPHGLERAREALLTRLGGSPRLAKDELTVVFDAANVAGRSSESVERRSARLRIVYSASGEIADAVIKRLAEQMLARREPGLVVVTDDNDIKLAVAEAAQFYDLDARLANLAPQEQQRARPRRHSINANFQAQGKGSAGKDAFAEDDNQPPRKGKKGNAHKRSKKERRQGPGDLGW
jgi:predicted RNA-binding protein with PIN domain